MKFNYLALGFLLMVNACKPGEDKQESSFTFKDAADPKLAALSAAWSMDSLTVTARSEQSEAADNLATGAKNNGEGSVTVFSKDGSFFSSNPQHQSFTKWTAQPPSSLQLSSPANTSDILIKEIGDNKLSLSYNLLFPDTKKAAARVTSVYHKLKDATDASISWADPSVYAWRATPKAAESNEQIAARVKSLLKYDYLMADAAFKDSVQNVNTNKFYLPFEYYQGAVALQRENAANERFANLFHSSEDAHKAFEVLRQAFKKVNYPKTGNFVQEYGLFFKDLANAIP